MNFLTEFHFPERGVRGAYVDIREGISDLLGWRSYAPDVAQLLGEALAATPLLASHLKFEGRINLQFQQGRALKLLVTQIDDHLRLRGMAQADADAAGGFAGLMGGGLLALMVEPRKGGAGYQGIVELQGDTLATALEGYFYRSEQLPTLVRLAASPGRFCGFMLQRLPARTGHDDDENWEHLRILGRTLGPDEMLATEPELVLHRLFHEETRRVTEPRAITLACRCSHATISAMLLSLGEQELDPVLRDQGQVEVTCEFCGRIYAYTDAEVRSLFAAAHSQPEHHTRQ